MSAQIETATSLEDWGWGLGGQNGILYIGGNRHGMGSEESETSKHPSNPGEFRFQLNLTDEDEHSVRVESEE